jgi:hypothetical protein
VVLVTPVTTSRLRGGAIVVVPHHKHDILHDRKVQFRMETNFQRLALADNQGFHSPPRERYCAVSLGELAALLMDRDKGAGAGNHENLVRLDYQPSPINIKLEGNLVVLLAPLAKTLSPMPFWL